MIDNYLRIIKHWKISVSFCLFSWLSFIYLDPLYSKDKDLAFFLIMFVAPILN